MGIKHPFISPKTDGGDATKVRPTGWNADHTIDGDVNFNGFSATNINQALVVNDPYNATSWDGNLSVPTKDAIRDKIEALILSGGGVTDFLALSDTPNAYTDKGRAYAQVNLAANALAFRFSTDEYIDIRDYHVGTLVAGSDIGPALQAIFDDIDGFANRVHIRIPRLRGDPGDGPDFSAYICSPITFPLNSAIVLEIECNTIDVQNTWSLHAGQTIRGKSGATFNQTFPYTVIPRPIIRRHTAVPNFYPILELQGCQNMLIEGVNITGGTTANQGDLLTFRYCAFGGSALGTGFRLSSCFWVQMDNIQFFGDATTYAAEFHGDPFVTGLVRGRDWIPNGNGILLKSGGVGFTCENFQVRDVHSEGQSAGQALFTLDSTDGVVGDIQIESPGISDTLLGSVSVIHNIGNNTSNVRVVNSPGGGANGEPISLTSDPIQNFVLDNTSMLRLGGVAEGATSLAATFQGYRGGQNFQMRTPSSIDAKLLCSPVGPTWTPFTPLAVIQDANLWTGSPVITKVAAPDGSTEAALVGTNSAIAYSASHTLAVGDWFIFGIWIRNNAGGPVTGSSVQIAAPFGSGVRFNHSEIDAAFFVNPTDPFWEDKTRDNGWRWCCLAAQVTNSPGTPQTITISMSPGTTRSYFAPCAAYISVASTPDAAFITNVARSLKGGWSSNAAAGEVSILDHQTLKAGHAGTTGGVKTNRIVTPVAGTLTIAAGIITVTGSYHRVDTEASAATDDLDTINGGVDGYKIVLRANNAARTVVVKDGLGNIELAGDFSLDNTQDTLELIFDSTLSRWLELGRSDNGA